MKVLVVGASGYLGYWVTRLLDERGAAVLALSRRGTTEHGRGITGNVTLTGLGLDPGVINGELSDTDAVVSCFGSVDWDMPPTDLVGLHVAGTRNVLELAAGLPRSPRVVHVSSVVALGRAEGVVGNRVLAVGQSFRNWYEYAKYRAEALAREERRVRVSIVRFGALLGPAPEHLVPLRGGPLQAVPYLLQGMPLLLEKGGRYPVYAGDVAAAAGVIAALVYADDPPRVCTYYDPRLPTLAQILEELCQPWGCVPRLVESSRGRWLQRLVGGRLGLSAATLAYDGPLAELNPADLDELPEPLPPERPGYIAGMAGQLRESRRPLLTAGAGR
jgi:nucleoside-diphosphate-sugar epimerase